MKTCRNCGFSNTDDCLFCEKCGQNMAKPQKKSKRIWILVSLSCALLIIAVVLLFTFRDKLPIIGKEQGQTETVASEEIQENAADNEMENDLQEQTPESAHLQEQMSGSGEGPESAVRESGQAESGEEKKADTDVDINGADQAYVQVMGTLEERDGRMALRMKEPSSVCAYNSRNKIIQAEDVEYLLLEGDDLEEHTGAEVLLKGKISAGDNRQFILAVVKVETLKEAAEEECAEQGTDNGQGADFANHHYSLIAADVTWQEAFDDCISRGGYLAQINSEEEYQSVIQMIEMEDMQNIHFYLGGRRDIDSREYYWVDHGGELSGELLNPDGNSWIAAHWMENEPSFTSEEDQEMYMNMILYQERWVFNDVPMDITVYYPGKTGYICEFDQ